MINYQLHNVLIEAEQFFGLELFCYHARNVNKASEKKNVLI